MTVAFVTPDPIKFEDVVKNLPDVNESGWFPELMASVNAYVQQEFKAGRITGNDYSTVYLGSMSEVLNAVMKYVLEQALVNAKLQIDAVSAERVSVELELLKEQSPWVLKKTVWDAEAAEAQAKLIREKILTEQLQQKSLEAQTKLYTIQSKAFVAKHWLSIAELYIKAHIVDITQTPGRGIWFLNLADIDAPGPNGTTIKVPGHGVPIEEVIAELKRSFKNPLPEDTVI
jgi:hypothetical protein